MNTKTKKAVARVTKSLEALSIEFANLAEMMEDEECDLAEDMEMFSRQLQDMLEDEEDKFSLKNVLKRHNQNC